MAQKVQKAIFPVAGLGTRFLPATKSIPKEIMTLVVRPLIQYAIDEARDAGIDEFIFVTARGKTSLEDYFDNAPELENRLKQNGKDKLLETLLQTNMASGAIAYIRQKEALGLGHAVWCARRLIGDEPVAVILTDDIIQTNGKSGLAQMINAHNEVGGNIVAAMKVEGPAISSYGVIDPESHNGSIIKAKGLVEKPSEKDAPSNFAVIGRYILEPEIFSILEDGKKGAGGEIQLTDAIDYLARTKGNVHGYCFDGTRYDCGSKSGYLEATIAHGLNNPELRDDLMKFIKKIAEEI